MRVILFEDNEVVHLYPMTIGRPAFLVSSAGYRLVDLAGRLDPKWGAMVRPHLRDVLRADYPHLADPPPAGDELVAMVNARLVPTVGVLANLDAFLRRGKPGVVRTGGSVAAAILALSTPPPPAEADAQEMEAYFNGLPAAKPEVELPLIEYPHDVLRHHVAGLAENLDDRLARGEYREIADGLFVASGAKLGEHVVTDTSGGPVLLDEGASIGPYTYLSGPAYVGPNSRVIEHSAIKDAVSLGHTCKVGGEVEASSIEPYTNKQHHGFLGHSCLGSWVNLGAGTSNSDLKNTYGPVSMEYDGRRVRTGMQFVGCFIGDYAKTAVNTSIFTGKTIGACSMVYGWVTTNVPSFVNYARSFGQVTEVPDEVMIAGQARMFRRRNVQQRPCDVQLLKDMHVLTRHERQIANEPLSL